MLSRFILFFIVALISVSNFAKSDDLDIKFSGFATLSASYSDEPDIAFAPNNLNKGHTGFSLSRDSLLGLQANIAVNNKWDAVIQGVYQDRSIKSFNNLLELGFVRYRPHRNFIIRAGRLNSDLYLLSEYPYVGYAYLWTRPPQEFYSLATSVGNYDGIDFEFNQYINDGFFRAKFGLGQTTTDLEVYNSDVEIKVDDFYILSTVYVKDAWTVRASTSYAKISGYETQPLKALINIFSNIPVSLFPQGAQFTKSLSQEREAYYLALGFTYDNFNWLIQGEIGKQRTTALAANNMGYITAGYRVDELTYFSGFSIIQDKTKPQTIDLGNSLDTLPIENRIVLGELFNNISDTANRLLVDQHSIKLGIKWAYSDHVVFKAQLDHFIINANGYGLWQLSSDVDIGVENNVNLISFSASVVF